MIYPKDARSGGSWIVACHDETVACLLNGAFEKHEKNPRRLLAGEGCSWNLYNI
jgi:hypothetical protein